MTDEERRKAGIELASRLFAGSPPPEPMPRQLARYTLEHLFGDVWQDGTLPLEERSLVTCAVLVAHGRESEQRAHFRGARNLGISREKLEAMITHVAHYAGWPVAMGASHVLAEVWAEMDAEADKSSESGPGRPGK
jgi:4-carboxymuconolactone decarboxylase